jgi:dinuclear metal center YbgI/SA1388 family protein
MKLKYLTNVLENLAPAQYQMSFDNSGLLVGHPEDQVEKVLCTLDVTDEVMDEAQDIGADCIVAHHPLIFQSLKRITGQTPTERLVVRAIRHGIAVYGIHTNLDQVAWGVNDRLAQAIGLTDTQILKPEKHTLKKLVTFCPDMNANDGTYYPGAIRQALFDAGAGQIGSYDQSSFNAEGKGTFRAPENSQPFVGNQSRMHVQDEVRIETVFPAPQQGAVIKALTGAHPYEEVAYDVYPLDNTFKAVGAGMIGHLPEPREEMAFLQELKRNLNAPGIRHTALTGQPVQKVAICGGAGRFTLPDAIKQGADALVTSDFKYHDFFDVDQHLLLADIGHYESEQFTPELLYNHIGSQLPEVTAAISACNTNPIHYL